MLCPSCGAANERGAAVCFTCRAVLTSLTLGSVLGGRYEILRLLGRGGMGAVYEARDRMLDETVALKVLRPELAGDEDLVRRFRSEIRLARKVTDANVARIYEYGEGDGLRWISMELVDGVSLKERVREGALPAREALELVAQAARGLEAIHAAGIVHRDLKSANIMLDRQGRIRVMDFGIAKGGEGATTPGYAVGTPEYMSPEQARGRRVDERSDIYSLAIVAFELLTGDVPYRAENSVSTLLMHIEAEPPLQGPAAARLPAAIIPVLERALAKEPAQRVATAAEFRRAWDEARAEAGSEPGIPAPARTRSGRPLAAAAAVLAAAVLAALAGRDRDGPSPPAPGPSAPSSAPSAPAPPATVATAHGSPVSTASARPPRPSPRAVTPTPGNPPDASALPAASPSDIPVLTLPSPSPSAQAGTPAPAANPATVAAPAQGLLFVSASPWAWVAVDGLHVGETPFRPIPLPPGTHDVQLTYPAYRPFHRRVVIRAGETYTLRHDWATMGVRVSR